MLDLEQRPDLTGLARSIDELFASLPEVAPEQFSEPWGLDDEEIGASTEAPFAADPDAAEALGVETDQEAAPTASDDEEPEPTELDLAVAAWLDGERHRDDEIRALGAECLKNRDLDSLARAVRDLVWASGDGEDPAAYGLAASLMSPVVLTRLVTHMGHERVEERRTEYFEVCRRIGPDAAAAIRDDLGDSTDRLARRICYSALIAMGDASRSVVEEMAESDNRFLVRNAVGILGETGGPRAIELVTGSLAHPDGRVRREAVLALAKLGDADAGQLAYGLLDDPQAAVRIAAVVTCGELRVERALKTLISMLDATSDPDEALPILHALGRLGDPSAVTAIEKHAVATLFSRPRTDVRVMAYRALAAIGTPHARRLLNKAVTDKDPAVKAGVKQILHMR